LSLVDGHPVLVVPQQEQEPVGAIALDQLFTQVQTAQPTSNLLHHSAATHFEIPDKIPPGFHDFLTVERHLIIVGGKGGVGKTTVAGAIAWGIAHRHPDQKIRVISIDPAHSLGDAFGTSLDHTPTDLTNNLSAQEINAERVLDQFREDYLWELAEMMSGDAHPDDSLSIAYGPAAWRQIVSQALPGIDEMLSLITVMELLETREQDLIILDTAPTGHLLRFLEMPTAMGDWLAWIFKLWIKYQDVVGRTDLMGRLRTLRQRVMQAQKKLKDETYTEFIGVLQAQSAIMSEAERLTRSLEKMGVRQSYIVHNRYHPGHDLPPDIFPQQTIVRLPQLPRGIDPKKQLAIAADLLF
jgi:arsenite-transporting ATPase